MRLRVYQPFILLIILIFIVGLACNFGASSNTEAIATEVSPTEILDPTDPPSPTELPPTEPPTPTAFLEPPTETPEGSALELDPISYQHATGLVEFNPPSGWIIEEDDGSVAASAPDDSGFIYLQATNVGYALDNDAFARFVDAREVNFFGGFEDYQEIERTFEEDIATVTKSLSFDGFPQIVLTLYNQQDQIIFAFDFWADADKFESYSEQYLEIIDTIFVDSFAATDTDPYFWVYTFSGPGDLFSIEVPTSWQYERDSSDTVVVDTFYSPDDHAVIQNIGYDDGTEISRSVAGEFALSLLRDYYADDISITDDQVQPDGSEQLLWNSADLDISGISFFESRGTTFLLFSVFWDNPYEDVYLDVLDYTISTYDIP